ncbi:MAG: flavodoxin domain-containing protein [Spirochaetia bacterium]|nr:flavodoxin domain-containing protein [Spirochaetia bacterium]
MKTLIVYAGRNGSTQKTAERIAGQIGAEAELVNLQKQPAPELTEYDNVILGGSILAGSVPKTLQKFIAQQREDAAFQESKYFPLLPNGRADRPVL